MVRAFVERFPLTPSGIATLALSVAALRFGAVRQDLVLTIAGSWGLALFALAGLAALLEALRARRDLRRAAPRDADRAELLEGTPSATGLELRRRFRPFAIEPRWRWVTPPGDVRLEGARGVHEFVVPRSRGLDVSIRRRLVVEDLLGLWRIRLDMVEPRAVLALPHAGAVREADLATCLASGDLLPHPHGPAEGDRADYRTYTRSDPARLILWKVYARTRQLRVRTAEPARTPETRPLVFLVAGERDDAAAGIARLLMESGVLGTGARFAADGAPLPVSDRDEVRESIALSARHRERGGSDLAAALASDAVESADPVVVVCPASDGPWLRRIVHQVARDPGRFLVLAAGDGRERGTEPGRVERLLFMPDPRAARGDPPGAMLRACRPLVGTGARVVLMDRASGALTRLSGTWSSGEAMAAVGAAGSGA